MESNQQIEEQEPGTDIALIEQDQSTVKILQEDDLKNLKEAVEKIKNFKRKYSVRKLQVTDINDKDQKEKLRLAIADVRTTKTSLEKDKKEKTLPYRNTVSFINSNYDKVIDAAESLLNPLKDHKKEIDELIEAEEKKIELQLQQRVNDRITKLIDAGASFDGSYYSIGSEEFNVPAISLGIVDIQTTPDGIFENILEQVVIKNSIISYETEKAIAEKKRLEDELIAKQKEDKRMFDEQQLKLKEEQEALRKEREEMNLMRKELQDEKERVAAEKLAEQVKLLNEAAAKAKERINLCYNKLTNLGMCKTALGFYLYEDINAGNTTELNLFNDNEWDNLIKKITPLIAEKKLAAEKKIIELKIVADKEIADKALADKKANDEANELWYKSELTKKGDKAIWEDFISKLKAISYPNVISIEYKELIANVKAFHYDLK